ncbi:PIN domain-containing protein [Streptomyces sp. A3M-1-3]|uniref:PIN domain-containing protein n=1 Tax=Streptomyces sp. A3M-1-3 TaxID=2962044 RepID=UPI0020B6B97A|nr:PIN domain-containing protein [Streptomyces sp. A3M-1-3]MCP3817611.1 PIN domain-containing protein [Streptomyces sp. A3M-1-3]
MILVADTCAIIAAYDADHQDTNGCESALNEASLVVVSALVLAEVDHVGTARLGRNNTRFVMGDIRRNARILRYVIPEITPDTLDHAEGVRDRYAALDLDLADAVNVVLAADYRTDTMLTTDRRDLRAIRPLTHHTAFRLLPDDA